MLTFRSEAVKSLIYNNYDNNTQKIRDSGFVAPIVWSLGFGRFVDIFPGTVVLDSR